MHYLSADSEHSRNQASFSGAHVLQWNRKCINIRIEGNVFFCAFYVHCVRWQIIHYCICSVGFITALQPNPTILCFKSKSDWMKLCKCLQIFFVMKLTQRQTAQREHMLLFQFIRAGFLISIVQSLQPDEVWHLGIFLGNYFRNVMISAYAYVRPSFSTNTPSCQRTQQVTQWLFGQRFLLFHGSLSLSPRMK